jgi:hypothetical protein
VAGVEFLDPKAVYYIVGRVEEVSEMWLRHGAESWGGTFEGWRKTVVIFVVVDFVLLCSFLSYVSFDPLPAKDYVSGILHFQIYSPNLWHGLTIKIWVS